MLPGPVLPTAAYGGYFGAGLGVMLLSVLTVSGREDLRGANALKNLLASAANAAAAVFFVALGVVSWPETLVMFAEAFVGGYAGGRLVRVLPAPAVRATVLCIGTLMTLIYAWRSWV